MRARHPWWLPLAAACGSALVRVVGATWRFTVRDAPEYTAALARGERFVYAFWHSALLPLAVLHKNEGIAVLVSRHRDGELITQLIEKLGFVAARGSSTHAGLAERTGRRMVPIGVAARPVRALRSWDRFRVPWPFARVLVSHGAPFTAPLASLAASSEGGTAAASDATAPGPPADASEAASAGPEESGRLQFQHALDTVSRDVRTRVGERL